MIPRTLSNSLSNYSCDLMTHLAALICNQSQNALNTGHLEWRTPQSGFIVLPQVRPPVFSYDLNDIHSSPSATTIPQLASHSNSLIPCSLHLIVYTWVGGLDIERVFWHL
jgi:hypothetical protein